MGESLASWRNSKEAIMAGNDDGGGGQNGGGEGWRRI